MAQGWRFRDLLFHPELVLEIPVGLGLLCGGVSEDDFNTLLARLQENGSSPISLFGIVGIVAFLAEKHPSVVAYEDQEATLPTAGHQGPEALGFGVVGRGELFHMSVGREDETVPAEACLGFAEPLRVEVERLDLQHLC